jgi:ribonuclease HI
MVFVDGACLDNGSSTAQAGYGVYFGDDSPHSISKAVNPCERQTNQRAEIHAAIAALYQIRRLIDFRNGNLTEIILVTDSAYVARSMSEYILKWRENDYTNSRGSDVVNRDLFKRLDGLIIELEDDNRRQVQFWKVPRCWNLDADELARDAAEAARD